LSDPRDVPVSQLLHKIVSALIDRPEFLTVKTSATEDGATFTIGAPPDHTGKLIGKQGRNAKSIRTLLGAAGMKLRRRYTVVITEEHLQSPGGGFGDP
jgi:predicted RNA-binding protein YlqC (UPF0109 family)